MEENKMDNSQTELKDEQNKMEEGQEQKFSQKDIDEIIAKRLQKAEEKHIKKLNEAIQKEKEEATRLANLSAEEKEKELTEKQAKELAAKENDITMRERKLEAIEILSKNGIDISLAEFILDKDLDVMESKIEKLKTAFNDAVKKSIDQRLKGKPPKDPGQDDKKTKRGSVVI